MPETVPGQAPGRSPAKERLRGAIDAWDNLQNKEPPQRVLTSDGTNVPNPEHDAWLTSVGELRREINTILENHPDLSDDAVRMGLPKRLVPGGVPDSKGSDTGRSGDTDTTGNDDLDKDKDKTKGGGGAGGGSPSRNRFLPGVKGKDFKVYTHNGRTYVSYWVEVGGHQVRVSWFVPKDDLKAYGLKEDEGRELNGAQFRKYKKSLFGNANRLKLHGEDRHPFQAWLEDVRAQYGGTGLLKNREVMQILLMGYAEGWSQESIKGQIRQTPWWQSTTQYSRRWNFELTDAEKKTTINSLRLKMQESLEATYGSDWRKHYSEEKLEKEVVRIASGRYGMEGNPDDAFDTWSTRITNRAERIDGSPAQINAGEARQAQVNSEANPAVMRAQIEQQAREWLGPNAVPASDVLSDWANRLAKGEKGTHEWEGYLKRQKKALFKYLDEDETWLDRASTYKSNAEKLLGTTLAYDDPFFQDLTAKKADGTSIEDQAMSAREFELMIRGSDRYWESDTADQEGQGILSLLERTFLGKAS